jgi:bifunctional ADP-heptose synthase (sugar kinase/adenylyltransferase)
MQCDKLLVGVDCDDLVRATKGPNRPIHGEMHRLNLLNSIQYVDMAFLLGKVEDLTGIAADFNVSKIFKSEAFRDRKVYGAEKAQLVTVPDIPGMISTTKIVEWIRAGWTSQGPIPLRE